MRTGQGYTESAPLEAMLWWARSMDDGTGAVFARAVGYRPPQASGQHRDGCTQAGWHGVFRSAHPCLPERAAAHRVRGGHAQDDHLTINIAGSAVTDEQLAGSCWLQVRAVLPTSAVPVSSPRT